MGNNVQIVTVDAGNVAERRFFCYKSKPKTEGYRRKLSWLTKRFDEGLRIKIATEGKRSVGFVECIPGEYGWRAVKAEGYLLIHCLWVVGQAKGQGTGSRLIQACLQEARAQGRAGVAMVTGSDNWLAADKILLRNGFERVDVAPPSFALLIKRFRDAPLPAFPTDWQARLDRLGPGLTLVRTDQCPYIDRLCQLRLDTARDMGLATRVVELKSSRDVQELAPSAYGVFQIVYSGKLLSYHWLNDEGFRSRLAQYVG